MSEFQIIVAVNTVLIVVALAYTYLFQKNEGRYIDPEKKLRRDNRYALVKLSNVSNKLLERFAKKGNAPNAAIMFVSSAMYVLIGQLYYKFGMEFGMTREQIKTRLRKGLDISMVTVDGEFERKRISG